ncbi:hypothetical protein Taro_010172 [Colocasia esculenta]|uniref:Uncharacterized protein n=1 Tax=Colocasia esculenta TaxID=4460 RepID=A0A843TY84_COLES|nr:hypothetical protein [Colocasia esculenta]
MTALCRKQARFGCPSIFMFGFASHLLQIVSMLGIVSYRTFHGRRVLVYLGTSSGYAVVWLKRVSVLVGPALGSQFLTTWIAPTRITARAAYQVLKVAIRYAIEIKAEEECDIPQNGADASILKNSVLPSYIEENSEKHKLENHNKTSALSHFNGKLQSTQHPDERKRG